jgi:hypothetical protein
VSFGTVDLELVQPVSPDPPPYAAQGGTRGLGAALETYDPGAARGQLDARGIAHATPGGEAIGDDNPSAGIDVDGFPESPILKLVKCGPNPDQRRKAAGEQISQSGGGPAGMEAITAVEYGVSDLAAGQQRWGKLLEPLQPIGEGYWQPFWGPTIRVRTSPLDGLSQVLIKVRSINEAIAALEERGLLGNTVDGNVAIDTDGDGGGLFRLCEVCT